jgi:hypothetical protein
MCVYLYLYISMMHVCVYTYTQLKKEKTKYKTMCIKLRAKVAQLMSENAGLKNSHHSHIEEKVCGVV